MKKLSIVFAFVSAILYALSIPCSKIILSYCGSTLLAGLLYFGAGLGMMIFFFVDRKSIKKEELLTKNDLPYTIMMVVLDIVAPILLLYGLRITAAENVALLNNFEIVATSLIALIFFKEKISFHLWVSILLISIASFFLGIDGFTSFSFSKGALFVLLATICWGFENNCTRKISSKNTYEIVMIKGLGSGLGSLFVGLFLKETVSSIPIVFCALLLGFISYGLSIFFYIRSQKTLGAAKTSCFYAVNPFISSLLSVLIFKEKLSWNYFIALGMMIIASIIIIMDTIIIHDKNEEVQKVTHG